jgi:membrane fusion protein (multidrug efflux system)
VGFNKPQPTDSKPALTEDNTKAAKAAIGQAEASLRDAQLQLSYTNITAPAAGRFGKKNVEVGNRVQTGTPLMAIVNNDYWVVANFKETQLENMKPGQMPEIKLDAFPHHTFKGRVDSVSPASGAQFSLLPPDNATKIVQRIPVKVTFDPASIQGYDLRITPGMSAEVSVEVK